MIYDIKLANILSYKEDTTFSMEGIETNAKAGETSLQQLTMADV